MELGPATWKPSDPGVLVDYDRRGRLHDGSHDQMETEILGAWFEARRRGESVALMANTVDTVTRLNQAAQQARIRNGELDSHAPGLDVDGQRLLVGDDVVTRRDDRTLRTDRGVMVKNRDPWTVETIHADGTVSPTARTGPVQLPADYVTEHVQLGYAQTSYATQGRTVNRPRKVGGSRPWKRLMSTNRPGQCNQNATKRSATRWYAMGWGYAETRRRQAFLPRAGIHCDPLGRCPRG